MAEAMLEKELPPKPNGNIPQDVEDQVEHPAVPGTKDVATGDGAVSSANMGTAPAGDGDPNALRNVDSHAIYGRFTRGRKNVIMAVLCYVGFLTQMAGVAILPAIPEVAETLQTSGVVINISNGLFFVFMSLSSAFWGRLAQTSVGRRNALRAASVLLTAFSAGAAAAPNVGSYFAFRMLMAFQNTCLLVVSIVVIGDIFHPTERGSALGLFMAGILVGPSLAPLLGGVIITFTSWRVIYWVVAGMSGLSILSIFTLIPETMYERPDTFASLSYGRRTLKIVGLLNPWEVLRPLLAYPNLWISALAVSSLVWNQYSLLTPIRYVINPRFNLTTPIQSALFFLPPGAGYFSGVFVGGRWSDWIVARYIRKRGRRVPEDRLWAAVIWMALVCPGFMVIYGWSVQKRFGGIPLVVISMFMQGFSQQLAFPSLNTYLVDVFQDKGGSSVAVAGNYMTRFLFTAGASAACLPAIRVIGVGWFSTMSGLFISFCSGLLWLCARYGESWRT
ncbi:hypothetical protein N3K66_008538 [Trichothecium roseum]|uniref:Uncharacterized protein n=1 Tax=Trichothecium roseum TaxID=47278 RepID=A0ACC0UQG3_9HYPO|nr:hypothetical protein N3K66_008538 [Trichothecium roseum]